MCLCQTEAYRCCAKQNDQIFTSLPVIPFINTPFIIFILSVYLKEISQLVLLILFPQGLGITYFNLSYLLLTIFVTCTLLFILSWYILGKIHYVSAVNCYSNFQRITFFCYILTHISHILYFGMFCYFIISNIIVPN